MPVYDRTSTPTFTAPPGTPVFKAVRLSLGTTTCSHGAILVPADSLPLGSRIKVSHSPARCELLRSGSSQPCDVAPTGQPSRSPRKDRPRLIRPDALAQVGGGFRDGLELIAPRYSQITRWSREWFAVFSIRVRHLVPYTGARLCLGPDLHGPARHTGLQGCTALSGHHDMLPQSYPGAYRPLTNSRVVRLDEGNTGLAHHCIAVSLRSVCPQDPGAKTTLISSGPML